jgi:hypothetical protein
MLLKVKGKRLSESQHLLKVMIQRFLTVNALTVSFQTFFSEWISIGDNVAERMTFIAQIVMSAAQKLTSVAKTETVLSSEDETHSSVTL